MRFIELPLYPVEWASKVRPIRQESLVHKLFLHHQTVRRVSFWRSRSNDGSDVYIDIQMGPLDNIGTWHSYWICFRFEWIRALDLLRGLYQHAAFFHESMQRDLDEDMQRIFITPSPRAIPAVNWKKEGF
jgi:hypothetical protein